MDFLVSAVIDFDAVQAENSLNSMGCSTNIWKADTLNNLTRSVLLLSILDVGFGALRIIFLSRKPLFFRTSLM